MNYATLDHAAQALLLSADADGRIHIPPSSAEEMDARVSILARLQKSGIVIREREVYYSSFVLTDAGKKLCEELASQPGAA